jgi:hypothetical protein
MTDVRSKQVDPVRHRALEQSVALSELDDFLGEAFARLRGGDDVGPPFAVFHGPVDEGTRSRVEVGVPAPDGDRELPGGRVVFGVARGDTGI